MDHPCPKCGYCPHCGRGGQHARWPWPTAPYPYWSVIPPYRTGDFPETWWSTTTTTSSPPVTVTSSN